MARSPLRKNSSRATIGLDVDGDFLAAAHVDNGRIVAAASRELPKGTMEGGEVVDRERLSNELKEFFKDSALPKNVSLGVANQQIVVRQIQFPALEDKKDLDAAVRFQAAETIAMPLEEAVLDYQLLPAAEESDGQPPRLNVVVVAARTAMLSELVEAARAAGLKPTNVDLDAFALVRTLAGDAPADVARVYCHLGGVANLAIATGSFCSFTRPLSSPWEGEAANVAAALAHEVRLSMDYYAAQPGMRPVGDMMLSGPGSRREDLVLELQAAMGLPVSVAQPLGHIDAGQLGPDEDPTRHTVSVGLAMGAAA